jgi:hypothetical protein
MFESSIGFPCLPSLDAADLLTRTWFPGGAPFPRGAPHVLVSRETKDKLDVLLASGDGHDLKADFRSEMRHVNPGDRVIGNEP